VTEGFYEKTNRVNETSRGQGPFDLQLFSQEKTEEATPRKQRKEREEGRVAQSRDLTAAVMLLTGIVMLFVFSGTAWNTYKGFFAWNMGNMASAGMGGNWVQRLVASGLKCFLAIWLPIALVAAVSAFTVLAVQVGLKITVKPLIPRADRFHPAKGFKRMFSLRSFVEAAKAFLKASILFAVLYFGLKGEIENLYGISRTDARVGIGYVFSMLFDLSLKLAGALLVLGLLDFAYQKWEHSRSIKMSKQEVKDEFKQTEGDPVIRQRIRRKQFEIGRNRMMAKVPDADVIITNPTHLAIALEYERGKTDAPVVVAKGAGYVALRIREIGEANDVPVVEDKSLARGMYPKVEIGDEIPEEFYVAVAEVLAYVFSLKKKTSTPDVKSAGQRR
jgi:flagellar biosynthetic protein FlhB